MESFNGLPLPAYLQVKVSENTKGGESETSPDGGSRKRVVVL